MYKISQQYCELPLHLAAEPGVKPRAAFELWCCYLLFLDTAVPNWNNKQKKAMHAHTQPSWHKKAAAQAAGGTNTSSARNLSWAQTHPTARVLGSEQAARHGTARHGASLPQLARSQSHPWIMCNCAPFCSLSLYIRVASPSQQRVFLLPFFLQKVKEAFGARLQSLLPRAGRAHGRYKTSFHVRS